VYLQKVRGQVEDMAALNQVGCNEQVPEGVVLDLDLAIPVSDHFEERVAEMLSNLKSSQTVMESCDNLRTDVACESNGPPVPPFMPRGRPVPPPLTDVESDVPDVPAWTPKVGTEEEALPETPMWSPTVDASVMLQVPATPDSPAPALVQQPLAPACNQVPLTQEQLDSFTQDICNHHLNMVGAGPVPCVPQPLQPQQVQEAPWYSGAVVQRPWYRVSFLGGIALRTAPNIESCCTGWMLRHNDVFEVCESILGMDGRVYLLLADGRGWAFDDSALFPHEPSIVHGRWSPTNVVLTNCLSPMEAAMEQAAYPAPMPMPVFEEQKTTRHKRGGVKRNKNKRAESKLMSDAEVDTDTSADAGSSRRSRSSSSSEQEVEKSIFKEEDFPSLLSTVK